MGMVGVRGLPLNEGVVFMCLRPKSIASEGLCFIPHITPGWGDVFGPSVWVYVSAP